MLHLILALIWASVGIYVFVNRDALPPAGIIQPTNLVIASAMLVVYNLLRWFFSLRAKRRQVKSQDDEPDDTPLSAN